MWILYTDDSFNLVRTTSSNGGSGGTEEKVTTSQPLKPCWAGLGQVEVLNPMRPWTFNVGLAWTLYYPKVPGKTTGNTLSVHARMERVCQVGVRSWRKNEACPTPRSPTHAESIMDDESIAEGWRAISQLTGAWEADPQEGDGFPLGGGVKRE